LRQTAVGRNFIISDAGWTDLNYYNVDISEESDDIIERILHTINRVLEFQQLQTKLELYIIIKLVRTQKIFQLMFMI
jgi:hypothetical protein